MKRKIYQKLLEWKNNKNQKPLMLFGARQVGKTYIIREFGRENFKNFIEINLFTRKDVIELYEKPINSDEKYESLKRILNFDLDLPNTLLFIDEIQESEELISELKYFCEEHNDLRIITAGSLLGVKIKRSHFSFPVGKVHREYMYPMDFEEFLWAFNEQLLIDEIKKSFISNTAIMDFLHEKALEYYRLYLITGGMPEVVNDLVIKNKSTINYDYEVLRSIIDSYIDDMSKYVQNNAEVIKIQSLYNSIPIELGNKSHKFQYSKIDKNARSRDYELPLDWLMASDIVIKTNAISKPDIPPELYKKEDIFKLYLNDVGVLNYKLGIKYKDILTDNLGENKGIIAENYVANQLFANGYTLYYYVNESSSEIDFVIYTDEGLIPVEVKSSDNTQSKSLKTYIENYKPNYAIRLSTRNFGFDKRTKIKSVPLYAAFMI